MFDIYLTRTSEPPSYVNFPRIETYCWNSCNVWEKKGEGALVNDKVVVVKCDGMMFVQSLDGEVNMMANESGYSGLLSCGVVLRRRLSDSGSGMLRVV